MTPRPFSVTWKLATPIVSPEHPIHLDALLAWAAVEAANGDLGAQENLPLERHVAADGRWVWRASKVIFNVRMRDREMRYRPFAPWEWGDDYGIRYRAGATKLKAGTGAYKGYVLTTPLLHVDQGRAWGIGDVDAVRALLERVTNLGKLRRHDRGRVIATTVKEDKDGDGLWKLRHLVAPEAGYVGMVATVRPPYWMRTNREYCWVPTEDVIRKALA